MQRFARYGLSAAAVLAMTLLTASVGRRLVQRAAAQHALENWGIPELTDHLNHAGLPMRLCSPRKDGLIDQAAYLTTTDKDWDGLSSLKRGSRLIQKWRGTVYCESVRKSREPAFDLDEEHYMVVGPFVFYGDAGLLERIRVILLP